VLYVLLHELTHIYDVKFLTSAEAHDTYFWILFSKLIMLAIELGVLDEAIFKKDQTRCDTEIIKVNDFMSV